MAFGFGKKQNTEDELAAQQYTNLAEKYALPEEYLHPTTKEERKARLKEIKAKRKELRKELKLQGITKKADFEFFASEMGLALPEDSKEGKWAAFLAWLSAIFRWLFLRWTLARAAVLALALLAATFIIAYVSEERGHFTVNLTTEMLRNGFQLSEDSEFPEDKTRLFALEINNSNATSVYEINRGIMEKDGSNNGPAYMCYTFYLRNNGTDTSNYAYTVNILSETLDTAKACWMMFFEDGKQVIYAKAQDDGKPESLYGYPDAPFKECAYDPEAQYYTSGSAVGIRTTPFLDDYTVLQGYVEDFKPGDVKKYSVVVWLEGDDPDCNNSIMGGHIGFNVQFDRIGEDEEGYFKGLFRTEYEKSYHNPTAAPEDYSHVTDENNRAHDEDE